MTADFFFFFSNFFTVMGRILLTQLVDEVADTTSGGGAPRHFLPPISAMDLWLLVGDESVGDGVCPNCGVLPVVSRLGLRGMVALEWARYRKFCERQGTAGAGFTGKGDSEDLEALDGGGR